MTLRALALCVLVIALLYAALHLAWRAWAWERGRVALLWSLVGMVEVSTEEFSGKVLRELE